MAIALELVESHGVFRGGGCTPRSVNFPVVVNIVGEMGIECAELLLIDDLFLISPRPEVALCLILRHLLHCLLGELNRALH